MLTHWRVAELVWLGLATLTVLIVSLSLGDVPLGIASALSGIICVILTAKGKLAAYYFGVVNCILSPSCAQIGPEHTTTAQKAATHTASDFPI